MPLALSWEVSVCTWKTETRRRTLSKKFMCHNLMTDFFFFPVLKKYIRRSKSGSGIKSLLAVYFCTVQKALDANTWIGKGNGLSDFHTGKSDIKSLISPSSRAQNITKHSHPTFACLATADHFFILPTLTRWTLSVAVHVSFPFKFHRFKRCSYQRGNLRSWDR